MMLAFHLAREYHRRGAWDALSVELDKIELGKSWLGRKRSHPEVEFMRGELAVVRQEFPAAEDVYGRMDPEHPLRAYGLFNLGVAFRDAGNLEGARRTFGGLSKMPAYTEEALDLGQRARLALALIAREQKEPTAAEEVLEDLPSRSRYRDTAMAAYGGLAMDTEDYELAARIWMTLQAEAHWTPATATARLGFPMSIERMAGQSPRATTATALAKYQQAEATFAARLQTLEGLNERAQDPQWVNGLLEVFAAQPADVPNEARAAKMQDMMQHWQKELGHTAWLEWLATDDVHQALVQWRDLRRMQTWVSQLPGHMTALKEVKDEQVRRSELASDLLVGEGLLDRRTVFAHRLDRMALQLIEARASEPEPNIDWMMPLATDEERSLLTELDGMRTLTQHMTPRDQAKWEARIGRLEGYVFYNIVSEQAKRVQVLQSQHDELAALLADIDARIARVEGARGQLVAGVGADFELFAYRAADIVVAVTEAQRSREVLLANEIRQRMMDEARQLQQYLLVTRIAIARATDQLAQVDDLNPDVDAGGPG